MGRPLWSTPGRCLQSLWCLRMMRWEDRKHAGEHGNNIHFLIATLENKKHTKFAFAGLKGCADEPKGFMLLM